MTVGSGGCLCKKNHRHPRGRAGELTQPDRYTPRFYNITTKKKATRTTQRALVTLTNIGLLAFAVGPRGSPETYKAEGEQSTHGAKKRIIGPQPQMQMPPPRIGILLGSRIIPFASLDEGGARAPILIFMDRLSSAIIGGGTSLMEMGPQPCNMKVTTCLVRGEDDVGFVVGTNILSASTTKGMNRLDKTNHNTPNLSNLNLIDDYKGLNKLIVRNGFRNAKHEIISGARTFSTDRVVNISGQDILSRPGPNNFHPKGMKQTTVDITRPNKGFKGPRRVQLNNP
ncbi:unnamed protein product [Dovyalis caffra]|uniref:Uncharacterized protein n=1 Tax=Dovyalis caffra TaxID=77055 RepID=A0AAV1QZI6_9ROSI|nr:unnamed protein product [Dovyalis caffra]